MVITAGLNRGLSDRDIENQRLTKSIREVFVSNRHIYGTRRIAKILALDNILISRKRIGKLMASADLFCKTKRKFKVTTDSKHNKPIAPNLLARKFDVDSPDKYWVGDITYIRTGSGWIYLATVIDLYSRQVIGWSMANNMKAKLINDALTMAIWKRKPQKGLIWHSDRGSQYASDSHRAILKDHGVIQSMSRKGNCWDNAVAESFFHTLKTELTNHYQFKNQKEAKNSIFEYIEVFYNRIRIHSSNNYLAPVEFEKVNKKSLKSA
ncbi:MAG: transposase InsO family protein [Myxococcota bacterium]